MTNLQGNKKLGYVLLDLDSTLISSIPSEEFNFDKEKDKAKNYTFHDMDGLYITFERPRLQELLTFLFQNFNVSVWTAGSKDYALFIVDKIILQNKPERKLDYVFFSYHCDIASKIGKGTKDLAVLWNKYGLNEFCENNTVIIDDYVEEVHKVQPKNCIIAIPFEYTNKDSHKDDYFQKLIPHMKNLLENINNKKSVMDMVPEINEKMK